MFVNTVLSVFRFIQISNTLLTKGETTAAEQLRAEDAAYCSLLDGFDTVLFGPRRAAESIRMYSWYSRLKYREMIVMDKSLQIIFILQEALLSDDHIWRDIQFYKKDVNYILCTFIVWRGSLLQSWLNVNVYPEEHSICVGPVMLPERNVSWLDSCKDIFFICPKGYGHRLCVYLTLFKKFNDVTRRASVANVRDERAEITWDTTVSTRGPWQWNRRGKA